MFSAAIFETVAGGDEVACGKPDPAARRLGESAYACLVFEDSDHGARAAVSAAASVVIVPDLKHPTFGTAASDGVETRSRSRRCCTGPRHTVYAKAQAHTQRMNLFSTASLARRDASEIATK